MVTTAAASLKKTLKKAVTDEFEEGAVIRWVAAGRFMYAAIKTPVGWFTTSRGNPFTPQTLTYEELVEVLGRSETSQVEYAETWSTIR